MELSPRNYVVLKKSLFAKHETPEIIVEVERLDQAKKELQKLVEEQPHAWLAKNKRAGRYYDEHRDEMVRLWIRRRRLYQ